MIGQMQAVGVIALLTGANHAHQHLTPMTLQAAEVSEQAADDNHQVAGDLDQDYACYVNATVDGVPFRMLVDTGSDDLAFNRNHLRNERWEKARMLRDCLRKQNALANILGEWVGNGGGPYNLLKDLALMARSLEAGACAAAASLRPPGCSDGVASLEACLAFGRVCSLAAAP